MTRVTLDRFHAAHHEPGTVRQGIDNSETMLINTDRQREYPCPDPNEVLPYPGVVVLWRGPQEAFVVDGPNMRECVIDLMKDVPRGTTFQVIQDNDSATRRSRVIDDLRSRGVLVRRFGA
jgi:hypothetical protein